jgi:predicted DNA-binding transcriptional regulator AlpA
MERKRKLINRREVQARTSLSRWTIARLEKAKKFPRHVDIVTGWHHWFEDEIDDHLERLAAERQESAA